MNDNDRKLIAENALYEKYGCKFTAIHTYMQHGAAFHASLITGSISDGVIKAAVNNDGTGIVDNYTAVRLRHMITRKIEWTLRDINEEYFIFTNNVLEYTESYKEDMRLSNYLALNPGDRFDISVFIGVERSGFTQLQERILKIRENLREEGLERGYLDVYLVKENCIRELVKEISKLDSMDTLAVKRILIQSGSPYLSIDIENDIMTGNDYRKGSEI